MAPRFLSRLRAAGLEYASPRVEPVLAFSRLFLALIALAGWQTRPLASAPYYQDGLWLLLGYAAHSLLLLIVLRTKSISSRHFVIWAHASDIVWPGLLCLFTNTPNSVFFLFFLFAMLAAAFRWGFFETMATAIVSSTILVLQALIVAYGSPHARQMLQSSVTPSRVIMRCGFLLMAGFLLGYLAETEKELRAEIALTNRLLASARIGGRFAAALHEVLTEFGSVFGASKVYEVVAQSSTGRVFKWDLSPASAATAQVREIAPPNQAAELMRVYPHTFYLRRNGSPDRCSIAALDDEGRRIDQPDINGLGMPVADAESLLVVTHEMGRDWSGRFVAVNARVGRPRDRELRLAQNIMRQVAPALYSVYLFRRFRSRAGAIERARVARELHDTAIQSFISIEMQVDVLRRRAAADSPQLADDLNRIQGLLRQEVLNLRELMQAMRPVDIGPHQFLDFIAQLVERFSRDTGVGVRFVSELQEVTLPATTCRELARVVQEGLVNIRKHSGAKSAIVRFGASDGVWKLVIDDDGHGFPFSGRHTLSELDRLHQGPTVIKERIRTVGGDMVIESNPGHGSRLEITVPQEGYESYG